MNLELLWRMPIEVQIHLMSALLCLLLGGYLFLGKKGSRQHKILGWIWVISMLIAAVSAGFIHGLRMIGPFSPIHIFIPITFIGIYQGVTHARGKNTRAHRASMRSLYWGALCIPFAFALAPNRLLAHILDTTQLEWIPMGLMAAIVLSVGTYYRWEGFWSELIRAVLQRAGIQK